MTGPRRFMLSNEALMLARGVARGGRPSASTVQFFEESGLATDGYLDADLSHVLLVLENSGLAVTATMLVPGESHYRLLSLAAPAGLDDFVANGGSDEVRDLVWLGAASTASVHLADFLGLATPGSHAVPMSFDVSRDGWFALCAIADHQTLEHLRTRIDGNRIVESPGPESLAAQAAESLTRADTFRATFAAERLAPVARSSADIAAGVADLQRAGLVAAAGTGIQLTAHGEVLVATIGQALVWGQITTAIAGDGGPPGCLTTVRAVTNALLVGWNADGSACSVNLHDGPSATLALYSVLTDAVNRSLPPAAEPTPPTGSSAPPPPSIRFCASCGRQLTPVAKFCASCGKPVPG